LANAESGGARPGRRELRTLQSRALRHAADVYSLAGHVGRGGWTWYTGAAAWTHRVWLEEVLGFQRRGDTFTINPVIPKDWPGFRLQYRYHNTIYRIVVEKPVQCFSGVNLVEVAGIR